LALLFWNTSGFTDIKQRFKLLFKWQQMLIILLPFVLVILPQMIYWYHIYGKPIVYSYKGEGFTNWRSPDLISLWFEPNNGLFPYMPVFLLIFIGIITNLIKKQKGAILPVLIFVLMSYVFASWSFPQFGCAFGCRPFSEFMAFFALSLASLIASVRFKSLKIIMLIFGFLCSLFIIKMTLIYNDNHFLTTTKWNWKEYNSLALRGIKISNQDLEDGWVQSEQVQKTDDPYKGNHVFIFTPEVEFSPPLFNQTFERDIFSHWRYADISIDIKSNGPVTAKLVSTIDSCNKRLNWSCQPIAYNYNNTVQWQTLHFYDVWVGGNYNSNVSLTYSMWNCDHCSFEFDNLRVFLH